MKKALPKKAKMTSTIPLKTVYVLSEAEKVNAVRAFLSGYLICDRPPLVRHVVENQVVSKPHMNRLAYVRKTEETEFRSLLSEMLRSKNPLDRNIRNSLAELFDNRPPIEIENRMLVFKFRSRGKRRNVYLNSAIADYVLALEFKGNGMKIEAAIQATMEAFKVSRSEVNRVRKLYLPLVLAARKSSK
jgi:hypothetical protein